MTVWYEGPLAAFDTETTGVDPERDRIVSAALVVQDAPGAEVRAVRWLVDPGVPVPEPAAAVHGLTGDHLREHGRRPAEAVGEIVRALVERASEGLPLVVMNAPFDLTLLDRESRRHHGASLTDAVASPPLHVLDPRVLDKHLDRYRKGRRTLAALCEHYGVELAEAHDAAADAAAALEVVREVGRRHARRLSSLSPTELHTLQSVWHAAQARGLQAWFARNGSDEKVDPAWPLRTEVPAAV
ncbi:exonuclease domain-containing protein [Streptomyces sp. HK10]|uniref:exonuclease domain-containing protein n=1 Tax=Streptomyces sp. HK10 TaxID=3373255 RepID=UPI0037484EC4